MEKKKSQAAVTDVTTPGVMLSDVPWQLVHQVSLPTCVCIF